MTNATDVSGAAAAHDRGEQARPRRLFDLTVVICSFGRTEALASTLDQLFSSHVASVKELRLREVLVIDQANSAANFEGFRGKRVRRIQQDNFGGSGGFTRGIIEALDDGAEWILLMDDDAIPDPLSFATLAAYVTQKQHTGFALHGAMFSSSDPKMICEAGAFVEEPETRRFGIVPRLAGHRPKEPLEADSELAKNTKVDYGAWWFFCVHADTVKQVGLPLPLFIRGDDREYGLRLKRAGIPTIALPGLRVWHPPHGERPHRWQMLYDWRNTFITKALYLGGRKGRMGLTWRFFWRTYRMIIGGFYETSELMIAGLEEYLKGPENNVRDHKKTLRRAKSIDGMYSDNVNLDKFTPQTLKPVDSWSKTRFVLQMLTLNGLLFRARQANADGRIPAFEDGNIDWRLSYRLPCFGIASRSNNSFKIYRRSRTIARKQLSRLLVATIRYWFAYNRLSTAWRVKACEFSSESFWRRFLGIDDTHAHPYTNAS
jgi:galactofuranosylgalactofuranosylrhamnosyl-N-acetylglucosaminyl-diphospho-decaprenol beta-1,5/1,6-galactofuranosyltransferase